MCTVAHVMDHLQESPLYVGGALGSGLVQIAGGRHFPIAPLLGLPAHLVSKVPFRLLRCNQKPVSFGT